MLHWLGFLACHAEPGGVVELDYCRRGSWEVHSLTTWGEEFSDAFKGFLQEAEYSVVLAFGLYSVHAKNDVS